MMRLRLPVFPAYATPLDKLGWWALRIVCVGVLLFLLLPIIVIIPLSFADSMFLVYPIPGWSLRWYENLFTSGDWTRAARNSFIVAPAATLIATSLGTLAAVGLSRANFRFKNLLMAVLIAPMVVPIVKAARSFVGVPLYAPAIANNKATLDALGDEARGLGFTRILPNALRPITTVTRDYTAQMARAKIAPDYEHFFGYMNLRVLLEGLRRAGPSVTPQSLVATLEKMRNVDLGGYKIDFSPSNHHGSKFVDLSVVGPGGKFIW